MWASLPHTHVPPTQAPGWESLEGHHCLADLPRPRSCSPKTWSTGVPTVPEAFRRARSMRRHCTGPPAGTHRQNSLLDGAAKRQDGVAKVGGKGGRKRALFCL